MIVMRFAGEWKSGIISNQSVFCCSKDIINYLVSGIKKCTHAAKKAEDKKNIGAGGGKKTIGFQKIYSPLTYLMTSP